MEKVGSGNYDGFSSNSETYLAASEYDAPRGYCVRFYSDYLSFTEYAKHEESGRTRCVLAFGAEGVAPEPVVPDYSTAALGDIMLSDGNLVKPGAITESQKAQAVGVVAYLYKDQTRVGEAVKTKLDRDAKGLVLALKNASSDGIAWSTNTTETVGDIYDQFGQAYANSYDGYSVTQSVFGKGDITSTYPAFAAVQTFQTSTPAPAATTGWYMPSIGEWADLLSDEGGLGGVDISTLKNTTEEFVVDIRGAQTTAINGLNTAMDKVGADNYDSFITSLHYWFASENSSVDAYSTYFSTSELSFSYGHKANATHRVRCVLAF